MPSWPKRNEGVLSFAVCGIIGCMLSAGCTLLIPKEKIPLTRMTATELATLLRQRETAIHSLKGLFTATVRGGFLPIASRIEGALYYRRPNTIRLRGFTPIGSEVFEFIQAGDLYTLRLPTLGRVLTGRQSAVADTARLARPFQLSVWAVGGVLGIGTVTNGETATLVEEEDRYRMDVYAGVGSETHEATPVRRLWFDRRTLLVVQEDRLTVNGEVDATIQYEDFRPLGVPVQGALLQQASEESELLRPFKISLEDGHGGGSIQIIFHEMLPNQMMTDKELGQAL